MGLAALLALAPGRALCAGDQDSERPPGDGAPEASGSAPPASATGVAEAGGSAPAAISSDASRTTPDGRSEEAPPPAGPAGDTGGRRLANVEGESDDPCDSANLELSYPRGTVLESSRLMLRWRSQDRGPFLVSVVDVEGRKVYGADTFGHELRVLVSSAEGEAADAQLRNGATYRWRVVPQFAPDPSACPTAEFRLLTAAESRDRAARLEAEAERLGVGDETREPGATIALGETLVEDGFYGEAEQRLLRLIERGYDDPRIKALLEQVYRKTGRLISLEELPELAPGGDLPF